MTNEGGVSDLERCFGAVDDRLCSPLSPWKAVRAIARERTVPVRAARAEVDAIVADVRLRLVPIGAAGAGIAGRADERYGQGAGHPARRDMADRFACACARTDDARLPYKDDDFTRTDMAWPESA